MALALAPPSRTIPHAQDFFLTSPQGIALIMDHLNAGIDDVIRNEVCRRTPYPVSCLFLSYVSTMTVASATPHSG